MTIKNRWFLLLAGLLSVGLVLGVACGDDDDDDDGDETPSATQSTGDGDRAPAEEQVITMQSGEPQFIDPHRSSFEQDIAVIRYMWRGLYNLTDNGEGGVDVVPEMAAGDPEINGNVYTVTLKEGLTWSDGEPLTAQHFADGARRGCDPNVNTDYGYLWGAGYLDLQGCSDWQAAPENAALGDALGVRAVDDLTVEYTLTQPSDRFTTLMSLWMTFPVRQDIVDANPDNWFLPGTVVVNGPYTLEEYTPGDSLVLAPNPEWSGQEPALQEITVQFIDDLSAAYRQFQTDELDLTRINAADIATAEGDSDLADQLLILPGARITWLQMQLNNEALSDVNVRRALSRAVDREALNDAVFDGVQTPALYWVVEGVEGHQGNEPFEDISGFDPEAARQALADAGFPGGEGFPELSIIVNTPERESAAEFLQQQFNEILGINIRIELVDSQTRAERFTSEQFELFIGGWQIDYPDIENPLFGLFETDGGNNHTGCSNPDVDGALERALAAENDEDRIAAYQDMETAIVTNFCGGGGLWQDSLPFLVSSRLGGIVPNGTIDAGAPGNYCIECWFVKAE
jgi:oligopeptide transport system substrate-binding protein